MTVGENLHSGKREDWVECLLMSSPLPALTLSLLSMGEVTIAEKDKGVGKSAVTSILCAGDCIHFSLA